MIEEKFDEIPNIKIIQKDYGKIPQIGVEEIMQEGYGKMLSFKEIQEGYSKLKN